MSDTMTVQCATCKTANRVVRGREGAICGRCREPLDAGAARGKAVNLTEGSFQREVLESGLPVLVDCWAPWCGPCRMLTPVIDGLAGQLAGKVKVAKLNVDEAPTLAGRMSIQGVPTLMAFKNGQLLGRQTGAGSADQIVGWLRQVGAL
ncbi:MAG: thioredoxin [Candidatus Sericytochromatia bacterium]